MARPVKPENTPTINPEKVKELDGALLNIEKAFGKGAIRRLGDTKIEPIEYISTGSMSLDLALGIGGVPRGRIIEIYGPESSGKTTLTLSIISEAQKLGGMAAFIDAEHALDPTYAKKLGVNIDELLVSQPDNGEQALEICEELVRSNALDVIVIDSVAALVPKSEIEGDMGQSSMGVHARLMSQALRKLTGAIHKSNTIVIFINQIRMKIGVMFGNPETTTGGNALKFYASVRMDVRRIETLTKGEDAVGARIKVKVVKNKVAPPFKKAEFDLYFDNRGLDKPSQILDSAVAMNFVKKSGAWFSYGDTRIGQGRENTATFLRENADMCNELEAKIRAALANGEAVKEVVVQDKETKGSEEVA